MADYNVEAHIEDWIVTAGDTINDSWDVYLNDDGSHDPANLYDMTGMQLDIHVKNSKGTIIKDWSSTGGGAAITIATSSFNIYDLTPLTIVGKYSFDVQLTNGSEISTIRKGKFIVQKQVT